MTANDDRNVETWKKAGYQGEHDESGIVIKMGSYFIRTPSIYEVATVLGRSHHDREVWQEYEAIADRIISDHNQVRAYREGLAELDVALAEHVDACVSTAWLVEWRQRLIDKGSN